MVTPLASTTPSTSTPSFPGGVTLEAIMAHLMHMDARINTLSDELCQVNTRVGRIVWQQAVMGGFTIGSSPSPLVSKNESDDGSSSDDADKDDGVD